MNTEESHSNTSSYVIFSSQSLNLTKSPNSTMDPEILLRMISQAQLRGMVLADALWIVSGFIGLLSATITMLVVLRSKSLMEVLHYHCVVHLALADLVLSIYYFIIGLKRLALFLAGTDGVTTAIGCLFEVGIGNFAIRAPSCQTAAMALVRLLAVICPLWFHNANVLLLKSTNYVMWLCAFLPTVALSFGIMPAVYFPNCIFGLVYNGVWALPLANLTMNIPSGCVVTLSICLIAAVLKHKYDRSIKFRAGGNQTEQTDFDKVSAKATRTSLAVAVSYGVCWLLPSVAGHVMVEIAALIGPFVNVVFSCGAAMNLLLYLLLDKKFRVECAKSCACAECCCQFFSICFKRSPASNSVAVQRIVIMAEASDHSSSRVSKAHDDDHGLNVRNIPFSTNHFSMVQNSF